MFFIVKLKVIFCKFYEIVSRGNALSKIKKQKKTIRSKTTIKTLNHNQIHYLKACRGQKLIPRIVFYFISFFLIFETII